MSTMSKPYPAQGGRHDSVLIAKVGWVQLRRLICYRVPFRSAPRNPKAMRWKIFCGALNLFLVCSTYRAAKEQGFERQAWSASLRLCAGPPSRERVEPVCDPAIGSSVPV